MASMHDWDWAEADRQFEQAIARQPRTSEARSWHAFLLSFADRFNEALAEARLAIELDPLAAVPQNILAAVLFIHGDHAGALAAATRAVALEPTSFVSHRSVGLAHYGAGRFAEARHAFEHALALSGRHQWMVAELCATLARLGDRAAADALHAELLARGGTEYIQRFVLTVTATALGRIDEALTMIEEACALREPVSFARLWPFFDPLRGLPRFEAVLDRVGKPGGVG
jgi:tetratricopeptide (TPR) repeat protein